MSTPEPTRADLTDLQTEMRRVLPMPGPRVSKTYRDVRAENQARYEASLRQRQRPTRVS